MLFRSFERFGGSLSGQEAGVAHLGAIIEAWAFGGLLLGCACRLLGRIFALFALLASSSRWRAFRRHVGYWVGVYERGAGYDMIARDGLRYVLRQLQILSPDLFW